LAFGVGVAFSLIRHTFAFCILIVIVHASLLTAQQL